MSNNYSKNNKKNLNNGTNFFKQKIFYGALIIGICVFAGGTIYLMVNNIINSARDLSSEDTPESGYLVENNYPDSILENTLTNEENDLLVSEDDVISQVDKNIVPDSAEASTIEGDKVPSIETSGDLLAQKDNTVEPKKEDAPSSSNSIPKNELPKTTQQPPKSEAPSEKNTTDKATTPESKSGTSNENTSAEPALNIFKKDTTADIEFSAPLPGKILSDYSMDKLIYSKTLEEWRTHSGVDIASPRGTVVCSIGDGIVLEIKKDPRYGITVVVGHDNDFKSIYANLATDDMVSPNQKVKKGDKISCVGNTSIFESAEPAHLHFELYKDEKVVDPKKYIKNLSAR